MKAKSLNFVIPTSKNFSEFEYEDKNYAIQEASKHEDDSSGIWIERVILSMLSDLDEEKERLTLLILIMRGDGYNFDHQSMANLYGMKLRGYMRVIQRVKKKLKKYKLEKRIEPQIGV